MHLGRRPSRRYSYLIWYLALVGGLLVLFLALDSYVVTGIDLGWPSLLTYAIYAGIPALEVAVLAVILLRSARKVRNLVIAVLVLDLVNVMLVFRGAFGFY